MKNGVASPRLAATITCPPGAQHAGGLAEERRHVDLGDEVEVIVGERQGGGVGDLERDPPLGVEPDLGAREPDHLLGEVDPADAGAGELAGEEERRLAGPGAEVEDPLGGGERRAVAVASAARWLTEPAPVRPSQPSALRSKKPRIAGRSTGHSHGARATVALRARPVSLIRDGIWRSPSLTPPMIPAVARFPAPGRAVL